MEGFIAILYELFGVAYLDRFSNDMYNNNFYLPIFIITMVVVVISALAYYYLLNHPRYNRWYHWSIWCSITCLINSIITWIAASDMLYTFYAEQGMDAGFSWTNYFVISAVSYLWSNVFFLIFSFIIKWGSCNCKRSPFL